MVAPLICNNEEDPIKNEGARVLIRSHPKPYESSCICCHETRVLIRSVPKPNAAFPQPNDASDEIDRPLVPEIRMFERVGTNADLSPIL